MWKLSTHLTLAVVVLAASCATEEVDSPTAAESRQVAMAQLEVEVHASVASIASHVEGIDRDSLTPKVLAPLTSSRVDITTASEFGRLARRPTHKVKIWIRR